jgi:hypothetical protein
VLSTLLQDPTNILENAVIGEWQNDDGSDEEDIVHQVTSGLNGNYLIATSRTFFAIQQALKSLSTQTIRWKI